MPAISARAAREAREEAARLKSRRYERAVLISQKRYFSIIKSAARTAVQAILPHSHQPQPELVTLQPTPTQQSSKQCTSCNSAAKLKCIGCLEWICHDHTAQHGLARCSRSINALIHPEPEPTPELDRPDTPRPDPYTEFHRCEMCYQLNNSQLEACEQCNECGHWACDSHAESSTTDVGCAYCTGMRDKIAAADLRDFARSLTDQIAAAAVSSYRNYVTGATVAALCTATNNSIDYRQPTNPRRFCFRTINFDVLPTDYQPDLTVSIQHKRYVDSLANRMFAVARSGAVLNHNDILIVVSLAADSAPQRVAGSIEYYKYY